MKLPKGTRIEKMDWMKQYYDEKKDDMNPKLLKLKDLAEKKLNCTLSQLAIAWVIANKDVSTCIMVASKVSQLDENFKGLEIQSPIPTFLKYKLLY